MSDNETAPASNFIHEMIDGEIKTGKSDGRIVTRFPPEPNGYLHIGHAKSICLNYGTAQKYNGTFHLRFDDTNPTKEDTEYVESIMEDVRWLGADWKDKLFFASDYFEKFYEYAVQLIKLGKAYVCELSDTEMREYRGTLTDPEKRVPTATVPLKKTLICLPVCAPGNLKTVPKFCVPRSIWRLRTFTCAIRSFTVSGIRPSQKRRSMVHLSDV